MSKYLFKIQYAVQAEKIVHALRNRGRRKLEMKSPSLRIHGCEKELDQQILLIRKRHF